MDKDEKLQLGVSEKTSDKKVLALTLHVQAWQKQSKFRHIIADPVLFEVCLEGKGLGAHPSLHTKAASCLRQHLHEACPGPLGGGRFSVFV